MSKYKWDLKELKLYRDTLVEEYDKHDDIDLKYRIMCSIDMYNMMLEILLKRKIDYEIFNDSLNDLNVKELMYEYFKTYTKDKIKIIDVLLNSHPIFNKYKKPYNNKDIDIWANNDELIEIAYDFFEKMTPSYIKDEFDKIINSNDNLINFSYSKGDKEYGGVTICEPFVNKKFINISRTNKLSDLIVLPHEAFHHIFMTENACCNEDYNTRYLMEVEGCLANILFGEYFKVTAITHKDYFIDVDKAIRTFQIEDLVIRNCLIDSISSNGSIRMNKLNKALSYYNIDTIDSAYELKECLVYPEEMLMKYNFSQLIAIDLYYIYKEDPDKCFYLLKNLKHNICTNNIFSLLRNNEITFMDDGYKNLDKYLKK